ncbi:uncharacterized protein LOC126690995 [Quercus robur]|uniref:uncharacterized protein LOC126690995 n=1 Tax=Quercus robur TaxID=38942 RepID=UPI0021631769|nr:uncharacterized protein LOC126690995 [Quercus robur]
MLYPKLVITSTIAYIFHLERQHKDFTGRHLFFPANLSIERLNTQSVEPKGRPVGGTEYSRCQAVPGGTGIAVLALLSSKAPNISHLQTAIHKLQNSHPILKSRLNSNTTTNTISFITSPTPFNLFKTKYIVVFRLHVSACDRTTAVSLLRELLELMSEEVGGGLTGNNKVEVSLKIEDLIPNGKAKKPLWSRGVDMLSYSVSSLRLTNLKFKDTRSPRSSQVVRLQMNQNETEKILAGCKSRGIKLCGALVVAGLIAAYSSKRRLDNQRKKYGVVTLTDCRSILDPALSNRHFGFYHFIKGGEKLWELAQKTYMAFANS